MATHKPHGGGEMPDSSMHPSDMLRMAEELVREKAGGLPLRIREYLDQAKPGLKKLVDAKFALKEIHTRYVSKLGWKISPAQLRVYMRETFNYPLPSAPRPPGAKKKAEKATKKATKRARRSAK